MILIHAAPAASRLHRIAPFIMHPIAATRCALSLARQRRQLAEMDDIRLADLGLSHTDARREAARPFWDAPTHWKA